jgi:Ca2+-binding RTX toxin-like protein
VSIADGNTSIATVVLTIANYEGVSISSGILRFGGGTGADLVTVSGSSLIVNGTARSLAGVTEVCIWGRGGNDDIDLSGVSVKSFVHGGQGNDQLVGGSSDDVIFGGDGDDMITGESGYDFLVGGTGKDRIVGSAGHDILVSGDVAFWLSLGDLRDINWVWKDSRTIQQHVVDDYIDETCGDFDSDMLTGLRRRPIHHQLRRQVHGLQAR